MQESKEQAPSLLRQMLQMPQKLQMLAPKLPVLKGTVHKMQQATPAMQQTWLKVQQAGPKMQQAGLKIQDNSLRKLLKSLNVQLVGFNPHLNNNTDLQ